MAYSRWQWKELNLPPVSCVTLGSLPNLSGYLCVQWSYVVKHLPWRVFTNTKKNSTLVFFKLFAQNETKWYPRSWIAIFGTYIVQIHWRKMKNMLPSVLQSRHISVNVLIHNLPIIFFACTHRCTYIFTKLVHTLLLHNLFLPPNKLLFVYFLLSNMSLTCVLVVA